MSVRAAVRGRSQLSRWREWDAGAWDMLVTQWNAPTLTCRLECQDGEC